MTPEDRALLPALHARAEQWRTQAEADAVIRDLLALIDRLLQQQEAQTEELRVADWLLTERQKILDAIPACPDHGPCVPHALEWIATVKAQQEAQARETAERIPVILTGPEAKRFHDPDLRRLPEWLDTLAARMARHDDTEALFMQEVCGLTNWAAIVRELLKAAPRGGRPAQDA